MKLSALSTMRLLISSPRPDIPRSDKGSLLQADRIMLFFLVAFIITIVNVPFFMANRFYASIEKLQVTNIQSFDIAYIQDLLSSVSSFASDAEQQKILVDQLKDSVDTSAPLVVSQQGVSATLASVLDQAKSSESEPKPSGKVYLDAPEQMFAPMSFGLEAEGFQVSAIQCPGCIHMRWDDLHGWVYENSEEFDPEQNLEVMRKAKAAAIAGSRVGLLYSENTKLALDPETMNEDVQVFARTSMDMVVHACMFFIAWGMLWVAGAVGLNWDKERNSGYLEPYILSTHPPWVLYSARIIRATGAIVALFLGFGLIALLWRTPLHWNLFLSLALFLPVGVVMVGLWSMLASVLFRRPRGRLFAKIALSPVTILIVWAVRVAFIWTALQANEPLRAIRLANSFMDNGHIYILLLTLVMAIVSVVLFFLVNLRVGNLRQGLAAPK